MSCTGQGLWYGLRWDVLGFWVGFGFTSDLSLFRIVAEVLMAGCYWEGQGVGFRTSFFGLLTITVGI